MEGEFQSLNRDWINFYGVGRRCYCLEEISFQSLNRDWINFYRQHLGAHQHQHPAFQSLNRDWINFYPGQNLEQFNFTINFLFSNPVMSKIFKKDDMISCINEEK